LASAWCRPKEKNVASSVARDFQVLDKLEAAQMTPQEFSAYAIVIGVESGKSLHSPRQLEFAREHDEDLQDLRAELQRRLGHWRRGLSDDDRRQIEARFMQSLLSIEMEAEALCNRVLGGRPLVMAKADIVRRHGRDAVAMAAHRGEVAQALASSRPAHDDSVAHYGLRRQPASVESILGVG
jgi:hypothetical protein